ncbi:hypothetical protein H6G89_05435 [Oscillatoria sp. FACHB-1407]|uniref:hypothetical protein n=1 Tax=Oscillatoria sp. FACHB-1407 TaxID=2692847 RepID=UPI001681CEC6|nr:hypothetical protein [Oscillatoria sp. FACHB-1407]MBD2460482.1 hypothetical protein [Oscillatoria sp. FACHB-1407]
MKGLTITTLAMTSLLLGMTAVATTAQPVEDWTTQAIGTYESRIWNGGEIIPATTEFIQATDGSLRGRYTMVEPSGSVPGLLSNCQMAEVQTIRCDWQDKYGTGVLEASFTEDFSRFNGYWGTDDEEPWLRWSGTRSRNP